MGKSRIPALVAITAVIVLWAAAVIMYFLNPFHTASRDPLARVLGYLTYRMPAASMEPTLHEGDVFVVKTWPLATRDPRAGEIIVFFYPPNPQIRYVKRVVATGGSTIEMHAGVVSVDGHTLDEPYVAQGPWMFPAYAEYPPVAVPPGHFFVLGDNRGNSEDSRTWGFVPRELVIGVYTPGGSEE